MWFSWGLPKTRGYYIMGFPIRYPQTCLEHPQTKQRFSSLKNSLELFLGDFRGSRVRGHQAVTAHSHSFLSSIKICAWGLHDGISTRESHNPLGLSAKIDLKERLKKVCKIITCFCWKIAFYHSFGSLCRSTSLFTSFYPHMFTCFCPGSRSQHTVSAVPWAPLLHIGHQILVDLTFLSSTGWCPPDISWFKNHYAPTGLALGLVASARKDLVDAASR